MFAVFGRTPQEMAALGRSFIKYTCLNIYNYSYTRKQTAHMFQFLKVTIPDEIKCYNLCISQSVGKFLTVDCGRCIWQSFHPANIPYRADVGFYIGPTSVCNTARHRPDIGYIYLASILPTWCRHRNMVHIFHIPCMKSSFLYFPVKEDNLSL